MNKKQCLYKEINRHLCEDTAPEEYLNSLQEPVFESEYPFTMLSKLKDIQQSPKHHPEGNVWNHTMLVVGEAAKRRDQSSNTRAFMWAALLHDIGKSVTTRERKGKITAYDHDKAGVGMTRDFLKCFIEDDIFIEKVAVMVRWHMQILYVVKALPYADIPNMKREVNVQDIALLGLCDRMGRVGANLKKEEDNIRTFLKRTK